MRYSSLVLILAFICTATATAQEPPSVPIDQCGLLQYNPVEGGCWTFNGYEIYGSLCGYGHGDIVRVIGDYTPTYSFCMVGACCLVADTVMPCGDCCSGMTGNADGSFSDEPDVGDVTAMVAVLFQGRTTYCPEELDVDGSGATGSAFNVSDLTCLVAYLFSQGPAPVACH